MRKGTKNHKLYLKTEENSLFKHCNGYGNEPNMEFIQHFFNSKYLFSDIEGFLCFFLTKVKLV